MPELSFKDCKAAVFPSSVFIPGAETEIQNLKIKGGHWDWSHGSWIPFSQASAKVMESPGAESNIILCAQMADAHPYDGHFQHLHTVCIPAPRAVWISSINMATERAQ